MLKCFTGHCTGVVELGVATCLCIGMHCAGLTLFHSWKPECLDSSYLFKHFCFLDDVLMGSTILASKASQFLLLLLGMQLWRIAGLHWCWLQGPGIINYKMLKMLWEPGFLCIDLCNEVVRAWASFTCFTFSLIGQELVGPLFVLVWLLGVVCLLFWLVCFVYVSGLSFRLSCLTMTTLAQLHDCHSCNDERSFDQKKKITSLLSSLLFLPVMTFLNPLTDGSVSTLKSYNGVDVMGNRHPTSQDIVATNTPLSFCSSRTTLLTSSRHCWCHPLFWSLFCNDRQLRTVRKHGINPGYALDSFALKLHPVNSLSPAALDKLFQTSKLKGAHSDIVWICLFHFVSLFWPMIVNVFVALRTEDCPCRIVAADWRANRPEHVP